MQPRRLVQRGTAGSRFATLRSIIGLTINGVGQRSRTSGSAPLGLQVLVPPALDPGAEICP